MTYKSYTDFSLAHHDAAVRFTKPYLKEPFLLDGENCPSALFDLRNGYFMRVFAKESPDPKHGAFVCALFSKDADGSLQTIYLARNLSRFNDGSLSPNVTLKETLARLEQAAVLMDSPYKDVPCFDPEFEAIPLSETPWRKAMAVRENPEDVREEIISIAPVAARGELYRRVAGVFRALHAKKCAL